MAVFVCVPTSFASAAPCSAEGSVRCPAGDFARPVRAAAAAPFNATCGYTAENVTGCPSTPHGGVAAETCVADVFEIPDHIGGFQGAVLCADGVIFLIPQVVRSLHFYTFDTHTHTMKATPSNGLERFKSLYSGGVYVDAIKTLYLVPFQARSIGMVDMADPNNTTLTHLVTAPPTPPFEMPEREHEWWVGYIRIGRYIAGVLVGSKIFLVPYDATTIGVLSVHADKTAELDEQEWNNQDEPSRLVGAAKFSCGVLVRGNLFLIPRTANFTGIVDVSGHDAPHVAVAVNSSLSFRADERGLQHKYAAAVLVDDTIYLAPCCAAQFAKINATSGHISEVRVGAVVLPTSGLCHVCQYSSAVRGNNGKIYFAPLNAAYIVEMDTANPAGSRQLLAGGALFGASNLRLYGGAVLADNGLIYLFPEDNGRLYNHYERYMGRITAVCAPEQEDKPRCECATCPGNSSSPSNSTACVCDSGYEETVQDDFACARCPPQLYRGGSDEACVVCAEGSVVTSNADACLITCPAGQYRSSPALCQTCPANSESPEGSAGVEACACLPGHREIEHAAAAFSCELCVAGKYLPSPGASACENCAAGKYGAAGGASTRRAASLESIVSYRESEAAQHTGLFGK